MKNLTLLFLSLLPFFSFAQVETQRIQDKRDGRVYETIKIGDINWFKTNLKYETASSHCPNFNKKETDCLSGNFYSYQELDEVCPEGWRIPDAQEWQAYFEYRLRQQGGTLLDIQIDTIQADFLTIIYKDTKEKVNLFGATNPLSLEEFGWVEGNKVKNKSTTTFWVKHSEIEDNRFHLHIGNDSYVAHTHKHDIDDAPKKQESLW
ncbi:MAG: FISUMP domain-containing protein [Bacteroidota bacterium]